jgi:hypothetical protein
MQWHDAEHNLPLITDQLTRKKDERQFTVPLVLMAVIDEAVKTSASAERRRRSSQDSARESFATNHILELGARSSKSGAI